MTTRFLRSLLAGLGASAMMTMAPMNVSFAIIGGNDAAPHEFPATVQLRYRNSYGWEYRHRCGGVLINPRVVLTAAHCVYNTAPGDLDVVFGEHQLSTPEGTEVVRSIGQIKVHPSFNSTTLANDIALIALSNEAPVVPGVVETVDRAAAPSAGAAVTAVGWGVSQPSTLSDILQRAGITVADAQTCREVAVASGHPYATAQLCAGASTANPCYADDGGPLYQWVNSRWVVVGVMSFNSQNANVQCHAPAAYTGVGNYNTWINNWATIYANPGGDGGNLTKVEMQCYPMGGVTRCSLQGPITQVYPLDLTWTSSNPELMLVYPSYGTRFPYSTNNTVIQFGLRNGSAMQACPSGTSINVSVRYANTYLGSATRSCP